MLEGPQFTQFEKFDALISSNGSDALATSPSESDKKLTKSTCRQVELSYSRFLLASVTVGKQMVFFVIFFHVTLLRCHGSRSLKSDNSP